MQEKELTGYPSVDKPWLQYYTEEELERKIPKGRMIDYVVECNKERLKEAALSFYGNVISFSSFFEKIDECARSLIGYGVKGGDCISICMLTCPEVVYLTYAANKIGAVCNYIAVNGTEAIIKEQITNTASNVLFVSDIASPVIQKCQADLNVKHVVEIHITESMPAPLKLIAGIKRKSNDCGFTRWGDFLRQGSKHRIIESGDESSPAIIEYTSGTTGTPKGVLLSNQNANALGLEHRSLSKLIDIVPGKTYMDMLPPFYAYGIFSGIHMPLCCCLCVILCPDPNPEKYPEFIKQFKPNMSVAGPLHIEALARNTSITDCSYLETIVYGGDKVTEAWEEEMASLLKKKGVKNKQQIGYGMTECCGVIALSKSNCNFMIPLVKNTIKVINPETGEELKYDEEGELCISSPTLMVGYYNNEEATAEVISVEDGIRWLHTGDLGCVNSEGHLKITGRLKRIFWRLGTDGIVYRVFPMNIEECISQCDGVEKCAVIGKKSPDHGYDIEAFIIASPPDTEAVESTVRRKCKEALPESSCPTKYTFVASIPTTPAGKIDYKKLEEIAQE